MPRKPSQMKRTGKAKASPRSKAAKAASKLGTGAAKKAVNVITKRKRAQAKLLKSI